MANVGIPKFGRGGAIPFAAIFFRNPNDGTRTSPLSFELNCLSVIGVLQLQRWLGLSIIVVES